MVKQNYWRGRVKKWPMIVTIKKKKKLKNGEKVTREIGNDIEKWKETKLQIKLYLKHIILIKLPIKPKKPEYVGETLKSNLWEYWI